MKNRMKKLLVLATAATMMTAAFTGCGSSSDGADNNADTSADKSADEGTSNENLSGSLSLAGSTSMEKLCEALKESFMEKNPGVTVTVEYTGLWFRNRVSDSRKRRYRRFIKSTYR